MATRSAALATDGERLGPGQRLDPQIDEIFADVMEEERAEDA